MDFAIFSIDNWTDLHTQAKFLRHLDTVRAMGNLTGSVIPTIGSYQGHLEPSYVMMAEDFVAHVLETPYVQNQNSFLWVGVEKQMPFWIKDRKGNVLDSGRLVQSTYQPLDQDSWTYRADYGVYFYKEGDN